MKFFKVFTSVATGLTLAAGSGAVYAQQPGTGANTTAAPVNFLSFGSQSGQPNRLTENRTHLYYTKDSKNSDIKVARSNHNGIHKGFRISVSSGKDRWTLEVHAPLNSSSITPGKYDRAGRAAARTAPGLNLFRSGMNCSKVSGSFDVREMKLSGTGTVEKLAVDFVHKCEQRDENTVIGAFRFHSSVPVPSGLAQPPVVENVTHDLPTLPEKLGSKPLPAAVQKSMQSILPVMNADKDIGEPEKNWRTSYGTLTVIDKVSKGRQHTYFALTAGHVVSNTPEYTRFAGLREKIEVRTPAGKMEPLTFIGLVTDNNNPAYANRELALLSFTSNTEIPVAQRASVRTNDPSTIESRYYIAGYPYGLTRVANGTPYGNDFTRDPEAHIGKPLITTGKVLSDEPSLKGFVTQMITVPADFIRSIPIQDLTNRRTGLEYPGIREFSRSEDATMPWNPSGTVVYTANTHFGHSGSPVLDQKGKVVAVHSIATPPASGDNARGPVASGGAFLDNHTNQIIDSLIQIEKNKINKK